VYRQPIEKRRVISRLREVVRDPVQSAARVKRCSVMFCDPRFSRETCLAECRMSRVTWADDRAPIDSLYRSSTICCGLRGRARHTH
jgi:hypothetical protein